MDKKLSRRASLKRIAIAAASGIGALALGRSDAAASCSSLCPGNYTGAAFCRLKTCPGGHVVQDGYRMRQRYIFNYLSGGCAYQYGSCGTAYFAEWDPGNCAPYSCSVR